MSICFLWGMPTWRAYVSDKRGPFSFIFLYLFSWVPEVGNHVSCPGISLTVCGILWSYSFHNNFLLPLYPLHSLPPPLQYFSARRPCPLKRGMKWSLSHLYFWKSLLSLPQDQITADLLPFFVFFFLNNRRFAAKDRSLVEDGNRTPSKRGVRKLRFFSFFFF